MPKAKPIPASSHAADPRLSTRDKAGDQVGKGLDGEPPATWDAGPKSSAVASAEGLPDWKTMPTAERDARLKKLETSGLSCSQIAAHFQHVSRNAVIGRLSRIEARSGKLDRARAKAGRPSAPKLPTDGRKDKVMINRIQVKTETPPERVQPTEKRGSFDPLPGVKPLPIVDLPVRLRCRWPIDLPETKTHFACGAATLSDTHVYCAPHRRLSVGA